MNTLVRIALSAAAVLTFSAPAFAQVDARMFRQPDVSATHITFVYAGDIWIVPKQGGLATRLSSPPGEEMFPRFSPDGSQIAFSANYDGNTDVYVVPALGGDVVRLTHHPMDDRVIDWHPDGKRILFASTRESGRQRFSQFYLVGRSGGLPERLPVPYGEFGAFDQSGTRFAYMPQSQDFRTWKRYRGGWAPDIWLFDLTATTAKNLTANDANDGQPMWHGSTLYFLSDRGAAERQNIYAYDTATGSTRQVTDFTDVDITFPAIGPDDIVFQAGGRLYLLDLTTEKAAEVRVQVVTDRMTLKPRTAKVEKLIVSASISPTGRRGVFEARGDVFTVPAEHGAVVNLTRSSGIAERYPRWSPDGKTLAYWSDRSGEYELVLRPADGTGQERKVTALGKGFRYSPQWSPDSKKIAFIDQTTQMRVIDAASGAISEVDRSAIWIAHDGLEHFRFAWSPDSRFVAYTRPVGTENNAVFIYDTKEKRARQVTSGYYEDAQPTFDPAGKYLFFMSDRTFQPVYGRFDNSWTYPNATGLVAVPLGKDTASPIAPRNDEEGKADEKKSDDEQDEEKKDEDKKDEDKKDEDGGKHGSAAGSTSGNGADTQKKSASSDSKGGGAEAKKPPKPVTIDFEHFEARAVVLPPKAGNYADLFALDGKLLYRRAPRSGSADEKSPIVYFDFKEREEKTVLDDADGMEPTVDGKQVFVVQKSKFAVIDIKPNQKFEKPMRVAEMEAPVDPSAEWRQIFTDAYRFERDFFYDPNMHGVDWTAMRAHYGKLLDDAVTRWDVNFVLGEFIGELNASHTYRGGGDEEEAPERAVGMLGVDWSLENGAYRVKRIVRGGPWDADARSPLAEPGVKVSDGDYVLAVNGIALDTSKDPWASFDGLADQTVILTVNSKPIAAGARQVVVKCLPSEVQLRYRAWIEERRKRVEEATGGRAGYLYVQSTGVEAQNELVRQFVAQRTKDALVVDERFNSGGQIPDRFIELLNRPILSYWAVRDGASVQWPPVAHRGPKVMLINGWSGSGGDAFPFYFREAKLGPLVGTRTWGGLIGVSGSPDLVDGGGVTVPTFRMYDPEGQWFAEGHGVDPDIRVDEDPAQLAKGRDSQLDRAIDEIQNALKTYQPGPKRPEYERRIPVTPTTASKTGQ
jgi:tricorn protease